MKKILKFCGLLLICGLFISLFTDFLGGYVDKVKDGLDNSSPDITEPVITQPVITEPVIEHDFTNLVPENIKNDVVVNGVLGTYDNKLCPDNLSLLANKTDFSEKITDGDFLFFGRNVKFNFYLNDSFVFSNPTGVAPNQIYLTSSSRNVYFYISIKNGVGSYCGFSSTSEDLINETQVFEFDSFEYKAYAYDGNYSYGIRLDCPDVVSTDLNDSNEVIDLTNLVPENIKQGVNIDGVVGTYDNSFNFSSPNLKMYDSTELKNYTSDFLAFGVVSYNAFDLDNNSITNISNSCAFFIYYDSNIKDLNVYLIDFSNNTFALYHEYQDIESVNITPSSTSHSFVLELD